MLSELVEQDCRQQLRAEEAARRGMERRGRLADLLAIPARELLPHRLDDLEARGISSSVLVTSSPSLASRDLLQPLQLVGASMTMRSCSMSSGQGLRTGLLRVKARTLCAFATAACAASSSSLAAATSSSSSNSNCSISRSVRWERGPCSSVELLDPQLEIRDQRFVARQLRPRIGGFGAPPHRDRPRCAAAPHVRSTARPGRRQDPKEA